MCSECGDGCDLIAEADAAIAAWRTEMVPMFRDFLKEEPNEPVWRDSLATCNRIIKGWKETAKRLRRERAGVAR